MSFFSTWRSINAGASIGSDFRIAISTVQSLGVSTFDGIFFDVYVDAVDNQALG